MLITREQAHHLAYVAPNLRVAPALRPRQLEIDLAKTILSLHEVIDQLQERLADASCTPVARIKAEITPKGN